MAHDGKSLQGGADFFLAQDRQAKSGVRGNEHPDGPFELHASRFRSLSRSRVEMGRFQCWHRNPKRKRGRGLGSSLTLRVLIVSTREQ